MTDRCDQCRHWGRDDDDGSGWEGQSIGFKACSGVKERWRIEIAIGIDYATTEAWLAAESEALKLARAYTQDGSDYKAELVTGPDFFCALFKPKEPA